MGPHELEAARIRMEALGMLIDTMRLLKGQIDRASDRNTNFAASAEAIRKIGETIMCGMFSTMETAKMLDSAEADSNG